MNEIEKARNVAQNLKPIALVVGQKLKPVAKYVHHRRGRFSAAGTVVVLYPFLRRPHHTWAEFEKDFRMYDQFNTRPKSRS